MRGRSQNPGSAPRHAIQDCQLEVACLGLSGVAEVSARAPPVLHDEVRVDLRLVENDELPEGPPAPEAVAHDGVVPTAQAELLQGTGVRLWLRRLELVPE